MPKKRDNPRQTWPIDEIAYNLGIEWFDYQTDCFVYVNDFAFEANWKLCLYYKTGAGKSVTAMTCLAIHGWTEAVVIAPPSTHDQWIEWGVKLGIEVTPMSHARFRMPDTKLSRTVPIIADEMHQFGGHKGKGWTKLDRLAKGLQAPMILASATPNYNDAERVYCIQHILQPQTCKGGFLEFLYQNCQTRQNPFGATPYVDGFLHYKDAAEYLAAIEGVMYLPDDAVYQIHDVAWPMKRDAALNTFGLAWRTNRIIASQIEERHYLVNYTLVGDDGYLRDEVWVLIQSLIQWDKPALLYADHASIAWAIYKILGAKGYPAELVTGKDTKPRKLEKIEKFRSGKTKFLVGTASLATGTDGLDKICDQLIIVDDTQDDSLRRQLIGRILPRGLSTGRTLKEIHRLVLA